MTNCAVFGLNKQHNLILLLLFLLLHSALILHPLCGTYTTVLTLCCSDGSTLLLIKFDVLTLDYFAALDLLFLPTLVPVSLRLGILFNYDCAVGDLEACLIALQLIS